MKYWLAWIGVLAASVGATMLAVHLGHPSSVWLYCTMLHLC
jgi:hypothetical protein